MDLWAAKFITFSRGQYPRTPMNAEGGDSSRTHPQHGQIRQNLATHFQGSTSFWSISPPLQSDKQNPRQQATLLKLDLCKESF